MIKAYSVTTDHEEVSVMVFAENASKARRMAQETCWLGDAEWIELKAKREPKADKYAEKFGAGPIDCDKPDERRMLRELGWYEVEGESQPCDECDLHQWSGVPESKLNDPCPNERTLCAGCIAAGATLETEPMNKL